MANRKKDQTNKAKRRVGRTISLKKLPPLKAPIAPLKPQKQTRVLPFVKRAITWFFVLLSGIVAVLYFYPRVSIQETTLLQPGNPFYYPFIIKNSGNIKVLDFSYDLHVINLVGNAGGKMGDVSSMGFSEHVPQIKVDGTHPINLIQIIEVPYNYIKEASIFIKYNYCITFIKIPFSDSTKFVLLTDVNKGYHWKEYQY